MEKVIQYGILEVIRRGETLRPSGNEAIDRFVMDVAMNMLDKGDVMESSLEEIGLRQEVYDLAKLRDEFMVFHKAWKHSTKPGAEKAWEKFKRSYKKELAKVVPLLMPAMRQQAAWMARASAAGKFVPEGKLRATWLNQRSWEDDLPAIDCEDGIEVYHPAYQRYLNWCSLGGYLLRLRQSDYMTWYEQRSPFNNRDTKASKAIQLRVFTLAHEVSARNKKEVIHNLKAQWAIEVE